MKLASALMERADIQSRIDDLSRRLNRNAKVMAGEKPAEAPELLLKEMEDAYIRLEELIFKINMTNAQTMVDGMSLTALLARRDCLKDRLHNMREFLGNASEKVQRYAKAEIAILSTVNVTDLQKQVDALSKELRIVDEKIQEKNWTTDLIEL